MGRKEPRTAAGRQCALHPARHPEADGPPPPSAAVRPILPFSLAATPPESRHTTHALKVLLASDLESPGFAQNFGSCGEVEGLHLVGVLTFGDEFREDVGLVGIQQKFRKALAWRGGDDKLGGRDARANGAQPGPEGVPDELGIRDREVVKQSMADDACLDEDVVGVELALDAVAVLGRGAVKMLVAIVAAQRLHVLHPEVIAERTDLAHSLLEGELDLESQAVETNDLDGLQRGVCAHEQARTSCWMNHRDEAYQAACGTPQQVADPILDDHLVL